MQPWETIDAYLGAVGVPVGTPTVGGTTGGVHASGSLHFQARARDYGTDRNDCWRIYDALVRHAQGPNWILEELFWDPSGQGWKRGDNIGAIGGHSDHVHAGIGVGKSLPASIEGGNPNEMLHESTDIAEHQQVGFGIGRDATIVRACNESREDHNARGHVAAARAAGVPLSLYAYCAPGGPAPEHTADLLISVARAVGIAPNVTLWADIEEGSGDLRWYEDRFVARVNAAGWPCGVYSGDDFWGAHNLVGAQGKWVANYGRNTGTVASTPSRPWDIHQFTSHPNLDRNRMTRALRDALFGRGPQRRKGSSTMHTVTTRVAEGEAGGGKSFLITEEWIASISNEYAQSLSASGMASAWVHPLEVVALAQRAGIPIDGKKVPQ